MRLIHTGGSWRVLGGRHGRHDSLERLAHEQGYRVDGLCRELGVGERYVREVFLRDVGLAPKEWLGRLRMEVARVGLAGGCDPLELSERLGFAHPNSFRRAFREAFGVAPGGFMEEKEAEEEQTPVDKLDGAWAG